jgi:hypothetical protein
MNKPQMNKKEQEIPKDFITSTIRSTNKDVRGGYLKQNFGKRAAQLNKLSLVNFDIYVNFI